MLQVPGRTLEILAGTRDGSGCKFGLRSKDKPDLAGSEVSVRC